MDAYSMDLRKRVLKDCDAGLGTLAVSVKYNVSPAWIRRLKQRRRETGETAPRTSRNKVKAEWLAYADRL
jgi:transposase